MGRVPPSRRRGGRARAGWRDGELMGAVLLFVFWASLVAFVLAVTCRRR